MQIQASVGDRSLDLKLMSTSKATADLAEDMEKMLLTRARGACADGAAKEWLTSLSGHVDDVSHFRSVFGYTEVRCA